mgnify:FL=1
MYYYNSRKELKRYILWGVCILQGDKVQSFQHFYLKNFTYFMSHASYVCLNYFQCKMAFTLFKSTYNIQITLGTLFPKSSFDNYLQPIVQGRVYAWYFFITYYIRMSICFLTRYVIKNQYGTNPYKISVHMCAHMQIHEHRNIFKY